MNIQKPFTHGMAVGSILTLIGLAVMTLIGRADVSVVVGAGQSTFDWCNSDGCWKQPPLPYSDERRPKSYLIGLRYQPVRHLSFDLLYHYFDPVRVSGTYVPDEDYIPQTKTVKSRASQYYARMVTHTDGLSLSVVPQTTVSGIDIFGRAGIFYFRQSTDWTYPPVEYSTLREAGKDSTPMLGFGVGHSFKKVSVALETFAFKKVKWQESPVGGGCGCGNRFGLVSYMLTASFKL